ncbi:MAG: hypothetical protein KBC05_18795, partial [Candidatus Hydrogenedentes bacterium]|nr:hypothetical protein [Candidatus Hydrogenedentota bacterium]HQM32845.1 hypothetical protein [Candidatus Hydrogenedentota bacterium]
MENARRRAKIWHYVRSKTLSGADEFQDANEEGRPMKKLLATLLVGVFVVVMAGCSGGAKDAAP